MNKNQNNTVLNVSQRIRFHWMAFKLIMKSKFWYSLEFHINKTSTRNCNLRIQIINNSSVAKRSSKNPFHVKGTECLIFFQVFLLPCAALQYNKWLVSSRYVLLPGSWSEPGLWLKSKIKELLTTWTEFEVSSLWVELWVRVSCWIHFKQMKNLSNQYG